MEDSGVLTHLRQSPEHSTNTAVPEWGVLIVEQQVTWTEDGGWDWLLCSHALEFCNTYVLVVLHQGCHTPIPRVSHHGQTWVWSQVFSIIDKFAILTYHPPSLTPLPMLKMCKKKHNYLPLIGAILVHFVPNGFFAVGNGHWEHSESKWLLGVRIGIGHWLCSEPKRLLGNCIGWGHSSTKNGI